jgi:hypothetical protein
MKNSRTFVVTETTNTALYNSRAIAAIADAGVKVTSLDVAADPTTGVMMFTLYFDDGAGNGDCILSLPVAELLKLAAKIGAHAL